MTYFGCIIVIILALTLMDKINHSVLHTTVWYFKVQVTCSHLVHRSSSLTSFNFSKVFSVLYAGEKETTVKQTSSYVLLLVVCISVLCVGVPKIEF